MSRAVVFKTPGLIDIRAFTHFGVNSKPNSTNPIGYFGTGLKYAIAVLVRHKLRPVVWIGTTKYTFKATSKKFRDREFDFVIMIKEDHGINFSGILKKRQYSLPFTTELGKNWELWQAFRELESNTRDESGETFILDPIAIKDEPYAVACTHIVVEGEKFVQEYLDRDKTFLPEGLTMREGMDILQVFERPSQHVYYRGLRVMDLPEDEPSANTYNILREVELTEDRTVKHDFEVRDIIASYLTSRAPKSVVTRAFKEPKGLEANARYDWTYSRPTDAFMEAVKEAPKAPISAKQLIKSHEPKAPIEDPFKDHPRPWFIGPDYRIWNAHHNPVDEAMLLRVIATINAMNPEDLKEHVAPTTSTPPTTDTDTLDEEIPF